MALLAISNQNVIWLRLGLKSRICDSCRTIQKRARQLEIQVGDEIDVALDAVEDGFGETVLSREKAKRHEAWLMLEKAYEENETVVGIINGKVKGGSLLN